jgi:hypothetical protein
MEGWEDGRMEGWKDGRMEGWKDLVNFVPDFVPLWLKKP